MIRDELVMATTPFTGKKGRRPLYSKSKVFIKNWLVGCFDHPRNIIAVPPAVAQKKKGKINKTSYFRGKVKPLWET